MKNIDTFEFEEAEQKATVIDFVARVQARDASRPILVIRGRAAGMLAAIMESAVQGRDDVDDGPGYHSTTALGGGAEFVAMDADGPVGTMLDDWRETIAATVAPGELRWLVIFGSAFAELPPEAEAVAARVDLVEGEEEGD